MLTLVQQKWRTKVCKDHQCMRKFLRSLNTETSKETYGYKFQKFMNWLTTEKHVKNNEEFETLLEWDSDKITDILEDYVDFMESRGDRNCGTDLASPELFFQNNRKLWHRELVRGGIKRDSGVLPGGELPIEDDELQAVYFGTPDLRKKAMVSMLSSLGIRPGALFDPVLRFKHLVEIENCYAIKIYDGFKEGYWGFLIPEARDDLDLYKLERIKGGEKITMESPIIATLPSRWNAKNDFMTDDNLRTILEKMIKGKVKRVKTGNRYDKALITMFRKRFNTKLKLNNTINSNVAELVMAHKLPGAQGNYTKPTMEECFKEVKKAIPELTIDPTLRQKAIIESQDNEISELVRARNAKIQELTEKVDLLSAEKKSTTIKPDALISDMIEKMLKEKNLIK